MNKKSESNKSKNMKEKQTYDTFTIATINVDGANRYLKIRRNNLIYWVTEKIKPDILMLQEIQKETTEKWIPYLLGEDKYFKYGNVHGSENTDSAILSKIPIISQGIIDLPKVSEKLHMVAKAPYIETTTKNGNKSFFITTHLAWGARNENIRLQQIQTIDTWVKEKIGDVADNNTIKVYLGGDFNAEENNSCLRYLKGEEANKQTGESTIWTDGFKYAKLGRKPKTIYTSTSENKYAKATAQSNTRIALPYAEFLPNRRIDYIFTSGYAHGSQGTPLKAGIWGYDLQSKNHNGNHTIISDHYGVWVKVLDIKKQ